MHEARKERPTRNPHGNQRGGVSLRLATVALIAVVAVAGAAAFVALSATGTGTSHTVTTCAPPTAPQCETHAHYTGSSVFSEVRLVGLGK